MRVSVCMSVCECEILCSDSREAGNAVDVYFGGHFSVADSLCWLGHQKPFPGSVPLVLQTGLKPRGFAA